MPLSLRSFIHEFWMFGIKQAWACLFGGVMLALIIGSKLVWEDDWQLTRYDFLFIAALAVQALLLLFKLETWEEAKIIFIYHVVGTAMEVFKTYIGSWEYPEANMLRIGGVPLFSGFMYSCIGSYIVRSTHVMQLRYSGYPNLWATYILCALIYLNFFTHHYAIDIRYGLFAFAALLYARCWVHFEVTNVPRRMPMLLAFVLIAFFIWIAENIGTFTTTWKYPNQSAWELVSLGKLGSWFLLMIISFVLVTLVLKPITPGEKE